jgi:hypothetical protein
MPYTAEAATENINTISRGDVDSSSRFGGIYSLHTV